MIPIAKRVPTRAHPPAGRSAGLALAALLGLVVALLAIAAPPAGAQGYSFNTISVEGNRRVDAATILSYADIARGESLSPAELDEAYQNVVETGLFESVEFTPQGSRLLISVEEYPTINVIAFEGNARLSDEDLRQVIASEPRRVYSPSQAEADASAIVDAYAEAGRFSATVDPQIIRRSENRVDLVFDIVEGKVIENERVSFVGNRAYSDRRLRRVIVTRQAGLLSFLRGSDTFVSDRLDLDRQRLRDFYAKRGYIDFEVLSVSSELTRERDAFLITFSLREGQSFDFGELTTSSSVPGIDADAYAEAIQIAPGRTYTPEAVENTVARMERLALQRGRDFIRVQPRITRNDRTLTLDVNFDITRADRVFVERIDIEGNTTTLDRVIRRQFDTVEGDPFNPREIRQAAERIRDLGYFESVDVNAREGTTPNQVIIDVDVVEQPTGTLSFGASYGVSTGVGLNLGFSEQNFLGRGQTLRFEITTGTDNASSSFTFAEPAFLGRDVRFAFNAFYGESDENNGTEYQTERIRLSPSLQFPVSRRGRLTVRYVYQRDDLFDYRGDSPIIADEADRGALVESGLGYTYEYDSIGVGLDPTKGVLLRFGQNFGGLGGDQDFVETTALFAAQRMAFGEDVTLRAEVEGGTLNFFDGGSRVTDRYFANSAIRGFEPNGLGPRDLEADSDDALGGNAYAVARFEARFPIGLSPETGVTGGAFFDIGSVWSLENTDGGRIDDSFSPRSVVGVSLFWRTPLGPLRLNLSHAIQKKDYDEEQNLDLTVSTDF